jgi:hypothetical protein
LEKVRQHFESFKAAALPAADLAGVPVAPTLAGEEKPEDLRELVGKRILVSKLIVRAIDRQAVAIMEVNVDRSIVPRCGACQRIWWGRSEGRPEKPMESHFACMTKNLDNRVIFCGAPDS